MSTPESNYQPRCMHLCCKAMMVYGEEFRSDPDFQAGLTDFWCQQTQKPYGPDQGDVNLEACSNGARGCFQEY